MLITTKTHIVLKIVYILQGGQMKHVWLIYSSLNMIQIQILISAVELQCGHRSKENYSYLCFVKYYGLGDAWSGHLVMSTIPDLLAYRPLMTQQIQKIEMGFITDNVFLTIPTDGLTFYDDYLYSYRKRSVHISFHQYFILIQVETKESMV